MNTFRLNLEIAKGVDNPLVKTLVESIEINAAFLQRADLTRSWTAPLKERLPSHLHDTLDVLGFDPFCGYKRGLNGDDGYYPFLSSEDEKNMIGNLMSRMFQLRELKTLYYTLQSMLSTLNIPYHAE